MLSAPPAAVLVRSAFKPVTAKSPAPLIVSVSASPINVALTVAVLLDSCDTLALFAPVVTNTESVATTAIVCVPANTIVSLESNNPLLTVNVPDAALFVTVVLTVPVSSSNVTTTVPVAVLVRSAVSALTVIAPPPLIVNTWPSNIAPASTAKPPVLLEWILEDTVPSV